MKKLLTLSLIAVLVLSSCKDGEKQDYLPNSIGAYNTLTIVIENELWKSEVGDRIRENFAARPQRTPVSGWTESAPPGWCRCGACRR